MATRTAHRSLSPPASWFHTSTIAMQRAIPIRIRPVRYSGRSGRKSHARTNMRTGPIIQFWTMDALRAFPCFFIFESSSYFTPASGGYIIQISPMAIGRETCSMRTESRIPATCGYNVPRMIPPAMARRIQRVRNLLITPRLPLPAPLLQPVVSSNPSPYF